MCKCPDCGKEMEGPVPAIGYYCVDKECNQKAFRKIAEEVVKNTPKYSEIDMQKVKDQYEYEIKKLKELLK